eukprot:GHUV01032484.1.p1 GENE.GHUV01032484.1~~GHUV01032484.1.p1  ORF type:complete len:140 (+),score=13.83 GHUV01032484.1:1-420(+)
MKSSMLITGIEMFTPGNKANRKGLRGWSWYAMGKMVSMQTHVGDPKTWASRILVLGYAFLVLIMVHLFTGRYGLVCISLGLACYQALAIDRQHGSWLCRAVALLLMVHLISGRSRWQFAACSLVSTVHLATSRLASPLG